LVDLHGDKAVWKLLERRPNEVTEVAVSGPVPLDVDTWDDYEAVLAAGGHR
jgi:molybdenum cofactor cytidylyltransferase